MKKRKILRIVLVIILVILIILLANTFRKFAIIRKLQRNISTYTSSKNYHIKSIVTQEFGQIITMNFYEKDNKQAMIIERNDNGKITKMSIYNNGERIDMFIDSSEGKIAQLDTASAISVSIGNCLQTENNWQTFIASIFTNIKKTNYSGKECYIISNFNSPMFMVGTEKNEVYIEKDTGLNVKSNFDNLITEREYEFDNVEDSIFSEPDLSQYTLKQK